MTTAQLSTVDQGLRAWMINVYNTMAAGLALSGVTAWFAAPVVATLSANWVIMLALALLPLVFIVALHFMDRFSTTVAYALYIGFSVAMGISLSSIFITYTMGSIVKVFFISTSVFAAASIYGYSTQRDLTSMGAFLFMGLIGIIVASIVNIWLASSMMDWVISVAAVLIFTGLTSYDTQKLKEEYMSGGNVYGFSSQERSSVYGALTLYLDFVNIFIHLLQLLGQKKE